MLIWFKRVLFVALACSVVTAVLIVFPLATLVTVEVEQGSLVGKQKKGVVEFLGVPFAQAPVGELRWQPPQPLNTWEGERKAFRKAPACLQGAKPNPAVLLGENEDCLYLNIWKPEGEGPFPVMLWIHGGAFLLGSGSEGSYDGEVLARNQQVIVITTNYRLSYLGFLRLPELEGEIISGNQGYLDQLAALQWVKQNIEHFGGDANNITLFGESAGSISVCMLLASPLTEGLIDKAIMQSGTCELQVVKNTADAEAYGMEILQRIGCAQNETPLTCARNKSHQEIYNALGISDYEIFNNASGQWSFSAYAVHGSDFLPALPLQLLEKQTKTLPLMIGVTANEGTLFDGMNTHAKPGEDWAIFLDNRYPQKGELLAQRYPWNGKTPSGEITAQILTDSVMTCPSRKLAELWSPTQPVYFYYFNQDVSAPVFELMSLMWNKNAAALGVAHSTEIPYVFGVNGVLGVVWKKQQKKTAKIMQNYWANFARAGNPNGEGLSSWPMYQTEQKNYLEFRNGAKNGVDLRKTYCEFWEENPLDFSSRS